MACKVIFPIYNRGNMNRFFSVLFFITFSQVAIASVVVHVHGDDSPTETTCNNIRTLVMDQQLTLSNIQCSPKAYRGFILSREVIQEAGYTIGELQKLILDYESNNSTEVNIWILNKKGELANVSVETFKK